jgi:hypothetical protein
MNEKIKSYNPEIQTLLRNSARKQELIKDFKATDQGYLDLMATVKEAQDAAKAYLEKYENAGEVIQEKKAIDKEIKMAIEAAAKGSEYEEKDKLKVLTAYFKARANEKVTEKIVLGDEFEVLNSIIES